MVTQALSEPRADASTGHPGAEQRHVDIAAAGHQGDALAPHPVALGIDLTGYRLVWTSTPNTWDTLDATVAQTHHFDYSLAMPVEILAQ